MIFAASYEKCQAVRDELIIHTLHAFDNSLRSQIVTLKEEQKSLRSQIVTSKGRGGNRYMPYAFREQGIAMLSSVLNSKKAIQMIPKAGAIHVGDQKMIIFPAAASKLIKQYFQS